MEKNKIYHKDCIDFLKEVEDGSVDLILTDPPYNASNSKLEFPDKHWASVNQEWDKGFTVDFVKLAIQKLKSNGSMLIFCSYHLLKDYLNTVDIKLQQIIHWTKTNPVPSFYKVYTPNVEYILWFVKGSPYTFNKKKAKTNVIQTKMVNNLDTTKYHPTQKPVMLMRRLVEVHSNEGELVLDCFMGSGTTALASKQLNRSFIGCDINKEYVEIAERRLSQKTLSEVSLLSSHD